MHKGFDEFMNLVIDDAVEVKLATKTDEEIRRELGKRCWLDRFLRARLTGLQVRYC